MNPFVIPLLAGAALVWLFAYAASRDELPARDDLPDDAWAPPSPSPVVDTRRAAQLTAVPSGPRRAIDGVVLMLAGRGSGKTTFLQACVDFWKKRGVLFVVLDRLGHWSDHPNVIVVRDDDAESIARKAIKLAPCVLVLDEIDLSYPSHDPPRRGSALYEVIHMGRQARGYGEFRRAGPVGLLGACRRPSNVHPDIRACADIVFLGRMVEPRDLKWAEQVAGHAAAAQLPGLRPGQFLPKKCS